MEEKTNTIKYHIKNKERKEVNSFIKVIKMLLCYEFVGAIIVGILIGIIIQGNQMDKFFFQYNGYIMIISFIIGLIFVKLYRKKEFKNDLVEVKRKMNKHTFVQIFFVFFIGQFLFMIGSNAFEYLLNCLGFTMQSAIDSATMQSESLSMILYGSFFAPVVEEIVFRGALCKGLSKYGKTFAIVVSAALFGIMHGNFIQGIFAFYIGLVLGYVALEYSLKWTILLHFINNFIFGVVIDGGLSLLNENISTIISLVLFFVFFIIGVFILWKYRNEIKLYIQNNQTEKGNYKKMFWNVWMVLYIIIHVLTAISMIEYIA